VVFFGVPAFPYTQGDWVSGRYIHVQPSPACAGGVKLVFGLILERGYLRCPARQSGVLDLVSGKEAFYLYWGPSSRMPTTKPRDYSMTCDWCWYVCVLDFTWLWITKHVNKCVEHCSWVRRSAYVFGRAPQHHTIIHALMAIRPCAPTDDAWLYMPTTPPTISASDSLRGPKKHKPLSLIKNFRDFHIYPVCSSHVERS